MFARVRRVSRIPYYERFRVGCYFLTGRNRVCVIRERTRAATRFTKRLPVYFPRACMYMCNTH